MQSLQKVKTGFTLCNRRKPTKVAKQIANRASYMLNLSATYLTTPLQHKLQRKLHRLTLAVESTANTCKNCAKCGKGFKIGTNEAYNIKIKIRLGGISKIFCFCSHANMAASDKGISLKKKFLKTFLLNVTN